MMIHFKEPNNIFTLRLEKGSTNSFYAELPASFVLCEFEGTTLQHMNINKLHNY